MLLPSPEIQKRLDEYQTISETEAKAIKHERRRLKRPRDITHSLIAGVALVSMTAGAYSDDVQHNQEIMEASYITIQTMGKALDEAGNDSAIISLQGTGATNSRELSNEVGTAVQPVIDGQLWSINYNQANLDSVEMGQKIIEKATNLGVTKLTFVFHSAGGNTGVEVQNYIREHSDITIQTVIFIATPYRASNLRQASRDQISLAESVKWIPNIKFSTLASTIGQVAGKSYLYSNGSFFENIENLITTTTISHDQVVNNKIASTQLVFSQILAIETTDFTTQISEMGDTTVVYLAIDGDTVVDGVKSSELMAEDAKASGTHCITDVVEGTVHNRLDVGHDQYVKVLEDNKLEIQASLKFQESMITLRNIPSKQDPISPKQPSNPLDDQ